MSLRLATFKPSQDSTSSEQNDTSNKVLRDAATSWLLDTRKSWKLLVPGCTAVPEVLLPGSWNGGSVSCHSLISVIPGRDVVGGSIWLMHFHVCHLRLLTEFIFFGYIHTLIISYSVYDGALPYPSES